MDKQLEELALTYLESRNRALSFPSMAEIANMNAENSFNRAMKLGYTEAQWKHALETLSKRK